jgi:hypothetical protein
MQVNNKLSSYKAKYLPWMEGLNKNSTKLTTNYKILMEIGRANMILCVSNMSRG